MVSGFFFSSFFSSSFLELNPAREKPEDSSFVAARTNPESPFSSFLGGPRLNVPSSFVAALLKPDSPLDSSSFARGFADRANPISVSSAFVYLRGFSGDAVSAFYVLLVQPPASALSIAPGPDNPTARSTSSAVPSAIRFYFIASSLAFLSASL